MNKRFIPGTPTGKTGGAKTSDLMMEALRKGEKMKPLKPAEQHQRIMEQKMQAKLMDLAMGGAKTSGILGGVKKAEGKNLSQSAKNVMEKAIKKKLEQQNSRKRQDEVQIVAKPLTGQQGGKIDAHGNIYNAFQKVVAKIDKKTGKIVSTEGVAIGKYSPYSPMSEFNIARFIDKMNTKMARAAAPGSAPGAAPAWDPATGGIGGAGGEKSGGTTWTTGKNGWTAKNSEDEWW